MPDLEYAFFDPQTRTYEILAAEPLTLAVSPAGGGQVAGGVSLSDIAEAPASDPLGWVRSSAFAAVQVVPLLAILGALVVRRRSRPRPPSRRERRATRNARLAELTAAVGVVADRSFFAHVAGFLRASVADTLHSHDLRTCPMSRFRRALEESGVGAGTRADLADLMARLDHARFAPAASSAAERRAFLDEAAVILNAIEREVRRSRRSPRAAALPAGVALLTILLGFGWVEARQQDFAAGVAAYRDGRFRDAAVAFAHYVEVHPRDAHAWYNLGNADFAAGDRGRAVWSWLKAVRVRPRYAEARHNLAAAGAHDTLRWLPPPFAIGVHEALFGVAVCWWLACTTLAIAILRRHSRWSIVAAAALVPALIVAAAALPASLRQPAAVTFDESTPLLAGPAHRSDEVRQLPQAALLAVLESRGAWLRVRTSDDVQGWVEAARVGTI
jgi:tetratricopeptide (TPR) repeat protein